MINLGKNFFPKVMKYDIRCKIATKFKAMNKNEEKKLCRVNWQKMSFQ